MSILYHRATLALREGKSDKVYIAEIVGADEPDRYIFRVRWGRRGSLILQNREEDCTTLDFARWMLETKVAEKVRKGYKVMSREPSSAFVRSGYKPSRTPQPLPRPVKAKEVVVERPPAVRRIKLRD